MKQGEKSRLEKKIAGIGDGSAEKKGVLIFLQLLKQQYLFLFACLFITLLSYIPAFHNGWTNWDDNTYVQENPLTQNLAFSTLGEFFTTFQVGNYHPFAMLSLALDYKLFGENATAFHTHNILLHLINVLLVFLFVQLLIRKQWVTIITALFFGIHPMHAESVAWISERKDLLYAFYYLAGLIAYVLYLQLSRKKLLYIIAMIVFLFSLFSKGQAVTFPIILLLIDFYLRRPFNLKLVLEKIPFFILSIIFGAIAVYAQHDAKAIHFLAYYSLPERLLLSGYSMVVYVYKTLLPLDLSTFYPYPRKVDNHFPAYVSGIALLSILLLGGVAYSIKRSRLIPFGFAFFLANIVLVLQLLPVGGALMADRYTYISYIGLFLIIGLGVQHIIDSRRNLKIPVLSLVLAFTVFFGIKTFARTSIWETSETVYLDAQRQYPYIPDFNNYLGIIYAKQGKKDLAMQYYQRVIEIDPGFKEVYGNLGDFYDMQMQYDSAIMNYTKLLQLDSTHIWTLHHRGNDYMIKGMTDEAIRDYSNAIRYEPHMPLGYSERSRAYLAKANYEEALRDALKATQIGTNDKKSKAKLYQGLGVAYNAVKQYNASDSCFDLAFRLDSETILVLNNYAYSLASRDMQLDNAERLAKKVVDALPDGGPSMDTYGWILFKQKKYGEAKTWLEKGMQHGLENDGEALEHYGDILFKLGDTEGALKQWQKAKEKNVQSTTIDQKIRDKRMD